MPTIDNIRNRAPVSGSEQMLDLVNSVTNRGRNIFLDANRLAEGLFGTHMAVNLFMMGVAYQGGLIPISLEAMEKAIEWNGVDIERNLQTFSWGRKYYEDAAWVESHATGSQPNRDRKGALPRFDRVAELREYQNEAYAQAYTDFLDNDLRPIPEGNRREVSLQAHGVQRRVRSSPLTHQAILRAERARHVGVRRNR